MINTHITAAHLTRERRLYLWHVKSHNTLRKMTTEEKKQEYLYSYVCIHLKSPVPGQYMSLDSCQR